MAHGFGGTRDAGLQPFAERISAAGIDVLAFDFRGFGASEGDPRQSISIKRQIQDYHAAVDAAKSLPGVDRSRLAIWGTSLSGGHVFHVAADRSDVAAVIAMTPLTSGMAASRASAGSRGVGTAVRWTALGVASRISLARGGAAKLMPLVSRPGEPGALALDGAYESYTSMAGPTWRNEVDVAVGFELGAVRTTSAAKRVEKPHSWFRSRTSTGTYPPNPSSRPRCMAAQRCTTTRAITSTCGPGTTGSRRRWETRWRS